MTNPVAPGQIRSHHRTGLTVEVIRQRPVAKDWVVRYLPDDGTTRHMGARVLANSYILTDYHDREGDDG